MDKEVFADGVSAVHVTGNMVRIDLMTLQPHLKSENGQPVYDIQQRVIMPLEGFVNGVAVQEDIIQQLFDKGILQNNKTAGPAVVAKAEGQRAEKE